MSDSWRSPVALIRRQRGREPPDTLEHPSQDTGTGSQENGGSGSAGPAVNQQLQPASPGGFAWSAGFGVEIEHFTFDGSFQRGFLINGPNLIGGGSGFLTMASAEYAF